MSTTAESIREIVREQLCLSPGEASDYESLKEKYQMDSLDMAEIILAVEDIGVELPLTYEFDTIRQLIEAVEAVV